MPLRAANCSLISSSWSSIDIHILSLYIYIYEYACHEEGYQEKSYMGIREVHEFSPSGCLGYPSERGKRFVYRHEWVHFGLDKKRVGLWGWQCQFERSGAAMHALHFYGHQLYSLCLQTTEQICWKRRKYNPQLRVILILPRWRNKTKPLSRCTLMLA